jgi:hypothetical protein|tara:strand:+ start:77 stop:370 length:294 start_codon:yes stop_codon:yes gene_type:complete
MISPTLTLVTVGVLTFTGVGLILSIPLCLLWNWLMPFIFGLPKLSLLQTFGLSILISLLYPRKIDIDNKKNVKDVDDTDLNQKLEKVLQDITSEFKA